MCNVCWKEFRGWCKSFTRIEAVLALLEGVLLLTLLGFLSFTILHFLACSKHELAYKWNETDKTDIFDESSDFDTTSSTAKSGQDIYHSKPKEKEDKLYGDRATGTVAPDRQCSWTPSEKTAATAHYYELGQSSESRPGQLNDLTSFQYVGETDQTPYSTTLLEESATAVEESDGDEPEPLYTKLVLALVKIRPLQELLLGCTLTAVSRRWALTAASCIEAIEEVDSLDAFVIMESHGELAGGTTHSVADVQIHPFYQGTNRSYDLAALKSDAALERNGFSVLLPELLDYLLVAMGKRYTILGYGKFRTPNEKVSGRRLRQVHVFGVAGAACAEAAWAPRHLWGGAAAGAAGGGCGAAPLCAGVLRARGHACNYCGGAPLLAGGVLLGVMAGGAGCGAACEPALYVNVAAVRDWLDSVIDSV